MLRISRNDKLSVSILKTGFRRCCIATTATSPRNDGLEQIFFNCHCEIFSQEKIVAIAKFGITYR